MVFFKKRNKDEKLRSLLFLLSRIGYHVNGPCSISFIDASGLINRPTTSIAVGWMHHSRFDDGTGHAGVKAFAVEFFSDVASMPHDISMFAVERRNLLLAASQALDVPVIDALLEPKRALLDAIMLGGPQDVGSVASAIAGLDDGSASQSDFAYAMCGLHLRHIKRALDLYNDGDLTMREFSDMIENPKLA